MDAVSMCGQLGLGLALGLGTVGSALGIGTAGQAAAGAWAKEAKAGKPLSSAYIIFTSMPLSQTFYAFMLVFIGLKKLSYDPAALSANAGALLSLGLACGLAQLFSAWFQGKVGAAACRCMSEGEGKGMGFLLLAMGIVETVGLFGFVLMWLMLPQAPEAAEAVEAGAELTMNWLHSATALLA